MASAPGKSFRQSMSPIKAMKMFPNDDAAEAWFMRVCYPRSPACPECDSTNVQTDKERVGMSTTRIYQRMREGTLPLSRRPGPGSIS